MKKDREITIKVINNKINKNNFNIFCIQSPTIHDNYNKLLNYNNSFKMLVYILFT